MRASSHRGPSRLAVLLVALVLAACTASPEERYAAAQGAAELKEQENLLKYFTRRSAAFLRDLLANGSRSKMPYLKDPFGLLPPGDIEEVAIDGNSAIIKIKGQKGSEEVWMVLENDEWSIDLFSLSRFWKPMREGL